MRSIPLPSGSIFPQEYWEHRDPRLRGGPGDAAEMQENASLVSGCTSSTEIDKKALLNLHTLLEVWQRDTKTRCTNDIETPK